jgi:hypothetical protein
MGRFREKKNFRRKEKSRRWMRLKRGSERHGKAVMEKAINDARKTRMMIVDWIGRKGALVAEIILDREISEKEKERKGDDER